MGRRTATALTILLLSGIAAADVTVDSSTRVVLGEQDQVSADLFGLTAFEGFPSVIANRDYRARVAALRPGCIRFGGSVGWCAPGEFEPAWYETDAAAREFTRTLLFGAKYPLGRFLPVVRELGAKPMFSFGQPPEYVLQEGTVNPSDFDKWAELCAAYVGLWKRFDPGFDLVQVWNEPNATWFKDPRASDQGTSAADLHIEMADKVAKAVKARFPEVQVGGPVLCWPPSWPPGQTGQKPWYTWHGWTLPWLEETKDAIDFFDFHCYDIAPDDLQVQVAMVANQSELTQGRRIPIWITESNCILNPTPEQLADPVELWNKRIIPYERFLLRGVLPQADKIAGNLYHDLHAKRHTLLPGSADKPDTAYWLLWILRDLRGTRVLAESDDPEVVTYATLEEDALTIVVFNDSDAAKTVPLSLHVSPGWWTGPYVRAIGEGEGGGCERIDVKVEVQRDGARATGSVTLPAHATVSIVFRTQGFRKPARARVTREYFGDAVLQFIEGTEPVGVSLTAPAQAEGTVRLRLGLLGTTGEEPLTAKLNGEEIEIEATALQDIALDAAKLGPENRLEVSLREPVENPALALGFASLVLESME